MDLNELIQAWRHALPSAIVRPLEAGKGGIEYVLAAAKTLQSIATAVVEGGIRQTYFLSAPRAAYSEGTVVLTYSGGGSYVLRDARYKTDDGRHYVGPPEQPVTSGAELEVRGEFTSSDYDFADDGVAVAYVSGTWVDPATGEEVDPPADIAVAIGDAPAGGHPGILELLCQGRDIHAMDGESAEGLRTRAWEPLRVVTRVRIEQLLNDLHWQLSQPGSVQCFDPREIGFAWGDGELGEWEGAAWGDGDGAVWCPRGPWFAVFIPAMPEQDAPDAWGDDSAWGDADFAWGEADAAVERAYATLVTAAREAAAKGIGVLVYIGEPLEPTGPPYVAAQGGDWDPIEPEKGPAGVTAADRYAYGAAAPMSYGGPDMVEDALNAFVWQDNQGEDYVFLVFDQPMPMEGGGGISTATGGSAALEISVVLGGEDVEVPIAVRDDPGDSYDAETGTFSWSWPPGTTDGLVIGPLSGYWRVQVTPGAVSNVSSVRIHSAGGSPLTYLIDTPFVLQRGPWEVGQG